MILIPSISNVIGHFAASCPGGEFFGLPKWYEYLNGTTDPTTHYCTPQITGLNDIWLIVAAILEILLRVAAFAAFAFVIYGGTLYIVSQGNPDRTSQARSTIIYALVGLVVSILSATLIAFIAGSFH